MIRFQETFIMRKVAFRQGQGTRYTNTTHALVILAGKNKKSPILLRIGLLQCKLEIRLVAAVHLVADLRGTFVILFANGLIEELFELLER